MLAGVAHGADVSVRWQARVDSYLARDRVEPPPLGAVVFTGSSSIDFWTTLREDFPGVTTVNRGIDGMRIADLSTFARQLVLPLRPRVVVLYAGENDLAAGGTVEAVVTAFEQARELIFTACPEARLVVLSLKPSLRRRALLPLMRETNTRLSALCDADKRCTFIDVFSPMLDATGEPRAELFDEKGLHMTPAGYRLWTALVAVAVPKDR